MENGEFWEIPLLGEMSACGQKGLAPAPRGLRPHLIIMGTGEARP